MVKRTVKMVLMNNTAVSTQMKTYLTVLTLICVNTVIIATGHRKWVQFMNNGHWKSISVTLVHI